MKICCHHCRKEFEIQTGHYNRAIGKGLNLYCNKICSGIGRRKSVEHKKSVKSEYDKKYRAANEEKRKQQKAKWFQKDYAANPEKYKAKRRHKKQSHAEYCRSPEYRKWKKQYDQKFRSGKLYGDFAEAAIILRELEMHIDRYQAFIEQEAHIKINSNGKRKRKQIQQSWKNNSLPSI